MPPNQRRLTFAQAEEIRRRYAAAGGRRGVLAQLGREYGLAHTPMSALVAGRTYQLPDTDPRARRTAGPRLTPAQRTALTQAAAAGVRRPQLTQTFGVSLSTIDRVLRAAKEDLMIKEPDDQRQAAAAGPPLDRSALPGANVASLRLSPREQVVLHLFATGQKGPDIARALGMSYRTLKRIIAELQEQLGAPSMFTLGMRSVELGLVPHRQQPLAENEMASGVAEK